MIELYITKLIETVVLVALFIIIQLVLNKHINRRINEKIVQKSRSVLIRRVLHLIVTILFIIILLIIWGVKQSELAVFVGSVLTIVGVAFFAQWSLLSNITSSIIIFFGHSVKIGDSIIIMETKDYEIKGTIINIGLFFTKLQMIESDQEITLPNNMFIIKTIRKVNDAELSSQNDTKNNDKL